MSFGLLVTNNAGLVVIDSAYRNYHLHSLGATVNGAALPALSQGQQLLVRPNGASGSLFRSSSAGAWIKSGTGSVGWAIIQESFNHRDENIGLVVVAPGGVVAFDSSRRGAHPVLTASVIQRPSDFVRTTVHLPPVAPGRTRFVGASAFVHGGFMWHQQDHLSHIRVSIAVWNSDTSIEIGEGVSDTYGPPTNAFSNMSFVYTFFDV